MGIGKRIKELRNAKGMTQSDLAEKCGLNRNSIYNYEKGKLTPKVVHIEKLAAALDVAAAYLSGYKEDDAAPNPFWSVDLEDKLKQVGHGTEWIEDERGEHYVLLKYPNCVLEVGEWELEELHNSTNEYMRFKLEELKRKHIQNAKLEGGGRNAKKNQRHD